MGLVFSIADRNTNTKNVNTIIVIKILCMSKEKRATEGGYTPLHDRVDTTVAGDLSESVCCLLRAGLE